MPTVSRAALGLALVALLSAPAALADDVSDRLTAALAAYEAGDLRATTTELGGATTALSQKKGALLAAVLPATPEGWTREINEDYAAGIAMAGGGTGAEARYIDPDGNEITVNYTMDSPLLAMMIGMFANEQMIAMLGKTVEVNGTRMVDQDTGMTTVIDNRILVQINGDETAKMVPLAQTIDFAALAVFDAPK